MDGTTRQKIKITTGAEPPAWVRAMHAATSMVPLDSLWWFRWCAFGAVSFVVSFGVMMAGSGSRADDHERCRVM